MTNASWICCQLGARQHYAIPRALFAVNRLKLLLTDIWAPNFFAVKLPSSVFSLRRLRERYHPSLAGAPVKAFDSTFVYFEFMQRIRKTGEWHRIMARNNLYGKKVAGALEQLTQNRAQLSRNDRPILFTYSYAALEILRYAKSQGWRTVMEQIDPGPAEIKIVQIEAAKNEYLKSDWQPPPSEYWSRWREECELADRIIVNSAWSLAGLQEVGIAADKMRVVPLAFQPRHEESKPKEYPRNFTKERPMRVLFLGQINLRKGVARLLEAARRVQDEPIEFWMVGPSQISVTKDDPAWNHRMGPEFDGDAGDHYRQADVFVLPTLSDGFAFRQLEALARKLPVISSKNCAIVVRDGVQ